LKSGPNDELVYVAIQMTTARDPLPIRSKPVLPRNHPGIGSTPVFEEHELPARLDNANHLLKSLRRMAVLQLSKSAGICQRGTYLSGS
jgi:hypothetical protein